MLCECIEKKPSKLTPAEGEIMMRCCGIWAKVFTTEIKTRQKHDVNKETVSARQHFKRKPQPRNQNALNKKLILF